MNQYFFKMNQAEKNDILDKHKTIYDGYVTQFGQQSNTQPLYVQDFANDKEGIVVSNTGNVKTYTNVGINESHLPLDMIGDGPDDLENGTVDFNDVEDRDDDYEFFSAGNSDDDYDFSFEDDTEDEESYEEEFFEEDEEIDFDDKLSLDLIKDVPDDLKEDFIVKLDESLSMFKRIIK